MCSSDLSYPKSKYKPLKGSYSGEFVEIDVKYDRRGAMENMTFFGKRVVFLGAHPDDIELGCGALLARIAPATEVRCVTFSDNQKNPLLTNLIEEHYASMAVLGVPREKVTLLDFETRRFPDARQEILEAMLKIQREFEPDIVFVHTKADVHQDHNTMTAEALRVFRGRMVLGFDVIRSSYRFFPDFLSIFLCFRNLATPFRQYTL